MLFEMEEKELRVFEENVWKRWGEYIIEQRREMHELGVPYMSFSMENIEEMRMSNGDEENRKKILGFIQDIIEEVPSYLVQLQTLSVILAISTLISPTDIRLDNFDPRHNESSHSIPPRIVSMNLVLPIYKTIYPNPGTLSTLPTMTHSNL